MLSLSCQEVCFVSVKRYFFLPLILLLALLTSCRGSDVFEKTDEGFREDRAVVLDPAAWPASAWGTIPWGGGVELQVFESGETRLIRDHRVYWLRPEGDRFILESRLYRTLHDETPALVIPVGEARVLTDGDLCRVEILSDPIRAFAEGKKTVLLKRSTSDSLEDMDRFIDFYHVSSIPHAQPNTRWSYSNAPEGEEEMDFISDETGSVTGFCRIEGETVACELLVGHHSFFWDCALVKQDACSVEDVLLYGSKRYTGNRDDRLRFTMDACYDPLGLVAETLPLTLTKHTTDELEEQNWLGMNYYELMFRMEQEGWLAEPVTLYDHDYASFYRLQRGEQTLLLMPDRAFESPYNEMFVQGYALYERRKLLTWGGLRPFDHSLADSYVPMAGNWFSYTVQSHGNIDANYSTFFLDDCRVAAVEFDLFGLWEEHNFMILDLYEGK